VVEIGTKAALEYRLNLRIVADAKDMVVVVMRSVTVEMAHPETCTVKDLVQTCLIAPTKDLTNTVATGTTTEGTGGLSSLTDSAVVLPTIGTRTELMFVNLL
jgi:hypothetical protein